MLGSQLMLNFTLLKVVSSLKANVKSPRESTGADVFYTNEKTATALRLSTSLLPTLL